MKEMLSWYGYDRRDSPPPPAAAHYERAEGGGGGRRTSGAATPTSDGSLSPRPVSPVTAALATGDQNQRTPVVCSWCNKLGAQLYTMGSKAFCSEPCFSQSRVANFRKTKLCDWCKNIRDSLNIEFINGDQQLQFCSETCLNAYKMNIFCKETEAHIQMLPQLRELVSRSSKDPLITPAMWLHDRAAGIGEAPLPSSDDLPGGGGPASDRRRLRRARPEPLPPRGPVRGVRARSHTMPVLELRERARRRPSAPARPVTTRPLPSAAPAAATSGPGVRPPPTTAAPALTVRPPPPAAAGAATVPTPGLALRPPPPSAAAAAAAAAAASWQRYHLLPPPLGAALPPISAAPPPPLPMQMAGLPPVTVLLPVPVAVPVPVPLPIPVPEDVCRQLLARFQRPKVPPPAAAAPPPVAPPSTAAAQADCPILKRELEKESASGSDAEGLDLTVRKRKTDHPRKIKMEEDDFD